VVDGDGAIMGLLDVVDLVGLVPHEAVHRPPVRTSAAA
jgi:hypothetical protein